MIPFRLHFPDSKIVNGNVFNLVPPFLLSIVFHLSCLPFNWSKEIKIDAVILIVRFIEWFEYRIDRMSNSPQYERQSIVRNWLQPCTCIVIVREQNRRAIHWIRHFFSKLTRQYDWPEQNCYSIGIFRNAFCIQTHRHDQFDSVFILPRTMHDEIAGRIFYRNNLFSIHLYVHSIERPLRIPNVEWECLGSFHRKY